jgi:urease accessory protein UreH
VGGDAVTVDAVVGPGCSCALMTQACERGFGRIVVSDIEVPSL